jgi:hypothetical protein
MRGHIAHVALFAAGLWLRPAFADAGSAVEWALETDTLSTTLPNAAPGPMTVRSCATCQEIQLTLDLTSRFYLATAPTSFADLRRAAQSKRFMAVYYRPATRIITRIVVHRAALR